jgi:hypothetical protein
MKLDLKAFSLTCGIIGGLGLFVLTWWIIMYEGVTGEPTMIGMVYRGYSISPMGSFVGLAYGVVDGIIGGLIFAWLYNKLS